MIEREVQGCIYTMAMNQSGQLINHIYAKSVNQMDNCQYYVGSSNRCEEDEEVHCTDSDIRRSPLRL